MESAQPADLQAVIRAATQVIIEPILRLWESDPHQFSKRPCPTCTAITALVGRRFGCNDPTAQTHGYIRR